MSFFPARFDELDEKITIWMADHGILFLRISVGIVFLWFGFLKFFPGWSPAEVLATNTIGVLTFDIVPARTALTILAAWECLIGLGLLTGVWLRATIFLLLVQMSGTVTPLIFFPELAFQKAPVILTIEGQYIIKNIVLVSAALVVGATVRGGRLVARRTD